MILGCNKSRVLPAQAESYTCGVLRGLGPARAGSYVGGVLRGRCPTRPGSYAGRVLREQRAPPSTFPHPQLRPPTPLARV